VRAVWRCWRKPRSVRAEDIAIPSRPPGDIAQIGFGYVGKLYDAAVGRLRKAWVFVFVLAYSALDVRTHRVRPEGRDLAAAAVEVFNTLGGVPRTLVPHNWNRGDKGDPRRSLSRVKVDREATKSAEFIEILARRTPPEPARALA
jgi:hypothetical protein